MTNTKKVLQIVFILCALAYAGHRFMAFKKIDSPDNANVVQTASQQAQISVNGFVDEVNNKYILKPDQRLAMALEFVNKLLSGKEESEVKINKDGEQWTVLVEDKPVANLSNLPSYEELLNVVADYAKASLSLSELRMKQEDKERIVNLINEFSFDKIFEALGLISVYFERNEINTELLTLAEKAYAYLNVQVFDEIGLNDNLRAQALAVSAMARVADCSDMKSQSIIAYSLGYKTSAKSIVRDLDPADSWYRFVNKSKLVDETQGQRLAGDNFSYMLDIFNLLNNSDKSKWGLILKEKMEGLDTARALYLSSYFVNLNYFELNRPANMMLVSAMFTYMNEKQWFSGSPQNLSEIGLIDAFENALNKRPEMYDNYLFVASDYDDYFRAYFYSSTLHMAKHYVTRLSSKDAARGYSKTLGKTENEAAQVISDWHENYVDMFFRKSNMRRLKDIIGTLPGHSTYFKILSLDRTERLAKTSREMKRSLVEQIFEKMDSRPDHLYYAAYSLYYYAIELKKSEDYFAKALAYAGPEDRSYRSRVNFAYMQRDKEAFMQLLNADDLIEVEINQLIEYFPKIFDKENFSSDKFEELVAKIKLKTGNIYNVVHPHAVYYFDSEDYERARDILLDWIENGKRKHNFDSPNAYRFLSNVYLKMNDLDKALEAIDKSIEYGQSMSMMQKMKILRKRKEYSAADSLAVKHYQRYPYKIRSLMEIAQRNWREKDYQKAFEEINKYKNSINGWDFARDIVDALEIAFEQNDELIFEAMQPFARSEKYYWAYEVTAKLFYDKGRKQLAYDLLANFSYPDYQQMRILTKMYKYLKDIEGADAAFKEVKSRLSNPMYPALANFAFEEGVPELMWTLIPDFPTGRLYQFVWIYRSYSLIMNDDIKENQKYVSILNEYLIQNPADVYSRVIEYNLGRIDGKTLMEAITSKELLCEVAYFIALKEMNDKNYSQAYDWYRIGVETAIDYYHEYHDSMNQLLEWQRSTLLHSALSEETIEKAKLKK